MGRIAFFAETESLVLLFLAGMEDMLPKMTQRLAEDDTPWEKVLYRAAKGGWVYTLGKMVEWPCHRLSGVQFTLEEGFYAQALMFMTAEFGEKGPTAHTERVLATEKYRTALKFLLTQGVIRKSKIDAMFESALRRCKSKELALLEKHISISEDRKEALVWNTLDRAHYSAVDSYTKRLLEGTDKVWGLLENPALAGKRLLNQALKKSTKWYVVQWVLSKPELAAEDVMDALRYAVRTEAIQYVEMLAADQKVTAVSLGGEFMGTKSTNVMAAILETRPPSAALILAKLRGACQTGKFADAHLLLEKLPPETDIHDCIKRAKSSYGGATSRLVSELRKWEENARRIRSRA